MINFEELLGKDETLLGELVCSSLSILYRDLASKLPSDEDRKSLDEYTSTLVQSVRLFSENGIPAPTDIDRRYPSNFGIALDRSLASTRYEVPTAAQAPRFKYPASTAFFDWLISLGKKYNSAYDYVKRVERVFRTEAEPTTTDVLAADPERVALIIDRYAVAEGRNASTLAALNAFCKFVVERKNKGE